MMMRRTAAVLAAACAAALPAGAAAQRGFGPSIEASAGMFTGGGGTFTERGGVALDAVLAIPLRRDGTGSVVAALTGGVTGPLAEDLECTLGPADECIPEFPTFLSVAAVAGVQRQIGGGSSARVMAGPGFYSASDGEAALGVQARADVARRIFFRTALVASVRGDLLPRYQGEMVRFGAFGLGFRIQ